MGDRYAHAVMCMGCALLAISGASGVRAWLDAHAAWLTPRRLKAASVALLVLAVALSTIGLKGTATGRTHHRATAAHAAAAPASALPSGVRDPRSGEGVRTTGKVGT